MTRSIGVSLLLVLAACDSRSTGAIDAGTADASVALADATVARSPVIRFASAGPPIPGPVVGGGYLYSPGIGQALYWTSPPGVAPNASWTQASWYVDPNAGSDSSSTCSSGSPCKTVMGGVVAKWATISPILPQSTTIYVTGPETLGQEAIVLAPVMTGGSNFAIAVTAAAVGGTFAPTTVTAKVQANSGGTDLLIAPASPPAGLAAGYLLVNTTGNSSAMVDYVSGGTYRLTQPLANAGLVPSLAQSFSEDGWAGTDTIQAYKPGLLNLKGFYPSSGDGTGSSPIASITGAWIPDSGGTSGDSTLSIATKGIVFQAFNDWIDPQVAFDGWLSLADSSVNNRNEFVNCYLNGGGSFRYASLIGGSSGESTSYTRLDNAIVDGDVILHGQVGVGTPYSTVGLAHIAAAGAPGAGTFFVGYGGQLQIYASYFPGPPILWGTGSSFFDIEGEGTVQLVATIESTESWATSLQLNPSTPAIVQSRSEGTAFVSGQAVSGIAWTAANLDKYGSLFSQVTGAKFTSGKANTQTLATYVSVTSLVALTAPTYAIVDTNVGDTALQAPTSLIPDSTFTVIDATNNAMAAPIAIFPINSAALENPLALNTYSTSEVFIRVPGQRVTWYLDYNNNTWRITSIAPTTYSGATTPTVGTFLVGDQLWNTNPIAGTPAGWQCILAGNYAGGPAGAPKWAPISLVQFDPSELTQYNFDYDAASVAPSSGSTAITAWKSKYGYSDSTANFQLSGTATAFAAGGTGPNGLPYVSFNGSSNKMTEANQSSENPFQEFYLVAKYNTTGGTSGTLVDGTTAFGSCRLYRNGANTTYLDTTEGGGSPYSGSNSNTETWGIWHVICVPGSGGSGTASVVSDSVTVISPTANTGSAANGVTMGVRGDSATDYASASIARLIGFRLPLTTAQRANVQTYLSAYYSVN